MAETIEITALITFVVMHAAAQRRVFDRRILCFGDGYELPQSLRPAEPPLSPFGLAPVH